MANRLADETSPYLLQHADNPVDWWPWSDDALRAAKEQDKPILLSVGYAACHWCHVMAHESFEDPAVAAIMNQHFVCIKVDREERPDIDALYMEAVQAMTGQGGWPMTVFLTPDGKPFYGGTYFPPEDRHGLPAFGKLLAAIATTWTDKRDQVDRQSERLVEHVSSAVRVATSDQPITARALNRAAEELEFAFDTVHAGFAGAPKFPQPMLIDLCMRLSARELHSAGDMATATLDAMGAGGIFDQLGGGFHRYSVDRSWTVPHFEKMLYDNAQLVRTYARSWQRTKSGFHRDVALATGRWMLDEMRDPQGGFYSSLDADSEGVEGKYYVWDLDEVRSVLGELAPTAIRQWGFTREGNWDENPNSALGGAVENPNSALGGAVGRNIPVLADRSGDSQKIAEARDALLSVRHKRTRPGTDTKVLAAWNGLAASGLAEAGVILGVDEWIDAAAAAMDFVFDEMVVKGRLMRAFGRRADGSVRVGPPGFSDDYAFVLEAALALFEATGRVAWLRRAVDVAGQALDLFWDAEHGGFFSTGSDQEQLIVRRKDLVDNAVPAANSVMALELQRLALFTGDMSYEDRAAETIRCVQDATERAPLAFGNMLAAIDFFTSDPKEILVVGPPNGKIDEILRSTYLPNRVIVRASEAEIDAMQELMPLVRDRSTIDGSTTVYVCKRGVCELPVTDAGALADRLAAA